MISLEQFMKTVDYRVTEGSTYDWRCYGDNAYSLSAWNGVHGAGGWSANITFDTKDQTVYEVDMCDYTNDRAYRVINPDFADAFVPVFDIFLVLILILIYIINLIFILYYYI
jgi:hypothetical protein